MVGVYKITNKVDNMIYIGQSWNIEKRWKIHKSHSHNERLKRSIKKYGIENFTFEMLFTINPESDTKKNIQIEIDKKEKEYILLYNSINEGYNLREGGSEKWPLPQWQKEKLNRNKPKHHSEETKRKMSEAHKGKVISEEQKKMISAVHKGKIVTEETRKKMSESSKNKIVSEETRKKISKAMKNRVLTKEWKNKISKSNAKKDHSWRNHSVLCIETGIIYKSIKEANVFLGLKSSHITSVCKGDLKTAGGYHWKYLEMEAVT